MTLDQTVLAVLFDSTGSDRDFLAEMIDTYQGDAPRLLAAMRTAVATNSQPEFVRAAHTLKGISLSLGALRLGSRCKELEDQARAGPLDDGAAQLPLLEAEIKRVVHALNAYLGRETLA